MKLASANLPTKYGHFKILVYQSKEDQREHAVLVKGKNLDRQSVLVRIHSQCLTGDVFSSLKCDCREQLITSLIKIGGAKNGVLIYLNQEGRGIGLSNKIKAYKLQEEGLDTIEANKKLGFADDLRDYKIAAQILKDLKLDKITLLTNNPDKASQLASQGITIVKCIPIEIAPNRLNKNYLKIKKSKLGHKLSLV